ncbi:hypothetical protein ACFLXO_04540 [Chloroflexota bacterium]
MITLQVVLDELEEMDVEPGEVEISRLARNYLIGKGQKVIDAEREEEE